MPPPGGPAGGLPRHNVNNSRPSPRPNAQLRRPALMRRPMPAGAGVGGPPAMNNTPTGGQMNPNAATGAPPRGNSFAAPLPPARGVNPNNNQNPADTGFLPPPRGINRSGPVGDSRLVGSLRHSRPMPGGAQPRELPPSNALPPASNTIAPPSLGTSAMPATRPGVMQPTTSLAGGPSLMRPGLPGAAGRNRCPMSSRSGSVSSGSGAAPPSSHAAAGGASAAVQPRLNQPNRSLSRGGGVGARRLPGAGRLAAARIRPALLAKRRAPAPLGRS